jgi:hypothetical protein
MATLLFAPQPLAYARGSVRRRFGAALRSRGVTVIAALDAGLIGKSDEEQLAFATERGCVLYTFNVSDFYRLHTQWASAGREHAGMILAPQQRFSVGEQLPRQLGMTVQKATTRSLDFSLQSTL